MRFNCPRCNHNDEVQEIFRIVGKILKNGNYRIYTKVPVRSRYNPRKFSCQRCRIFFFDKKVRKDFFHEDVTFKSKSMNRGKK